MLSKGISCILLLIHIISTVRGDVKSICKGQCTKLSCPETNTEDKASINVLWKKQTGEIVMWRDSGLDTKGQTYSNRNVTISEDLSLVISECTQSDQGIYILHINGQLLCKVTLLVNGRCKRSSENPQCGNPQLPTDVTHEHEDLQIETSLARSRYGLMLIFLLAFIICVVGFVRRHNTSKNNASEFKEIPLDSTVVQSKNASENFI